MSWIDNQLSTKDDWGDSELLSVDAGKWFRIMDALQASREALQAFEVTDRTLSDAAIKKIDNLGK